MAEKQKQQVSYKVFHMNIWRVKIFGFAIGRDNYKNWFIQRFERGHLKRAIHSKSLFHVLSALIKKTK
jgi:hypothetical protein